MRILFATDGSPGAENALRFLLSLPLSVADHVTVLTVPRFTFAGLADGEAAVALPAGAESRKDAGRVAETARGRLSTLNVPAATLVADGPVAEAIERAAIERAEELVVIGSRGLGAIAGVLLGSTGRALARHAPISLLVVRERRETPRRILAAVDGSPESDVAMDLICRLPLPADVEITLLHVLGESQPIGADHDGLADELRAVLEVKDSASASEALFRATSSTRTIGRAVDSRTRRPERAHRAPGARRRR
ncbi:MAG: universal stress protein [Chloroflexota bacterium]